jgi:FtsZ-interacting cell division protein YlmF
MKKQSFGEKIKRFFIDPDHAEYVEVEEYEEEQEWGYDSGITRIDDFREGRVNNTVRFSQGSDTIAFHSKKNTNGYDLDNTVSPGSHIVKSEPKSIDQAHEICDLVKQGKVVAVQMEGVNTQDCQRIMDFLSGVAHSLGGEIEQLSNRIFLVAPKGVEMSEHHVEQLKATGIFASFRRRDKDKA